MRSSNETGLLSLRGRFGFSVSLTDVLADSGVSDKQVTLLTCDFQLNAAVFVTLITAVKQKWKEAP